MKFSEASAKAEGVPAVIAGRVKIEKCEFNGPFEMDLPPILKLVPKTQTEPDGKKTVLVSPTTGKPYYKRTVFIPFVAGGEKYYTASNSPLLFALFRDFPVKEETETEKGIKWIFLDDVIEGSLRFTKKPYDYGSRVGSKPVSTIEEAKK